MNTDEKIVQKTLIQSDTENLFSEFQTLRKRDINRSSVCGKRMRVGLYTWGWGGGGGERAGVHR